MGWGDKSLTGEDSREARRRGSGAHKTAPGAHRKGWKGGGCWAMGPWGWANAVEWPGQGEQGENYWGLVLKRWRASHARQSWLWVDAGGGVVWQTPTEVLF